MITKLLYVQPSELKFPCTQAQLNKLSACWLQLTNRTDHNVAFKVKTTHPRKYCVRPNVGIVSPGSTRVVRVSMQVQKESIVAGVPKDKFLIQSLIAPVGLSVEDITSEMFRKERGNGLEEYMLRVAFVTANPPSPIPEGSEEECSPEACEQEKAKHKRRLSKLFDSSCETSLSSEVCTSMKEEDLQDQCSEVSTSAEVSEDQLSDASAYVSESKNQSSRSQLSASFEDPMLRGLRLALKVIIGNRLALYQWITR
ncbi:hypothetical protein Cgig2_010502 [Carnegiea gigantea]|uniref:MSP domain-containing protein n=1 Tax=Carnegiea gigantea TaxID=171969 RepID=A0A9Q1KT65_9CARY|nr:hypothetical protein Cgig2_010502 [Carnegiea gigantea]